MMRITPKCKALFKINNFVKQFSFSTLKRKNEDYRFSFEDSLAWMDYLEDNGFVVVNAISPKDADEAFEHLIDTLCYLSDFKLDKKNPNTFADYSNYPHMWKKSIIQYVAHTKWQWELREKCAQIFAKLWNTSEYELATSFDGFCYFSDKLKYPEQGLLSWLHTDQFPSNHPKLCFQGVLNLRTCYEDDGGLVVIPKSHFSHYTFFEQIGKLHQTDNYYILSEEEKKLPIFETPLKVFAEKGDLMIFDSRTFHCNTPPKYGHHRSCIYICQIPKNSVSENVRRQRKIAISDHRTSTHNPGEFFEVFPAIPYEAKSDLIQKINSISIKIEEFTPLQRSLACFSDFDGEYLYQKVGEKVSEEEKNKILIRCRQF